MPHTVWTMKRRYTVLFFVALSPLIGCSWLAAQWEMSMWSMIRGIGMFGMLVAAAAAAWALVGKRNDKTWAVIAAVASVPNALQMLDVFGAVRYLMDDLVGVAILLISLGSIGTLGTAITISVLPQPRPPQEPQVAPARVVD